MTEPHDVLGVRAGAPIDEVRAAYRRYVVTHHPDRGGDAARFLAGQEAYRRLVAGLGEEPDVVVRFHQRHSLLGTMRRTVRSAAHRISRRPVRPPRVQ